MCDRLETRYVNLTDTITVPAEWPVDLLRKFLVSLAVQVINDVNAGKAVILQVSNTPTKLVQRQNRNRIQYFFEKVFAEELVDSHVFDVIVDVNNNNTEAMIEVSGAEPCNSNALERRMSLDNYNIKVYRSSFRTTYYLVPIAESMPMPRPVQAQQHASYKRNTLSEREVIADGILLLLILVTTPLWLLIYTIFHAN